MSDWKKIEPLWSLSDTFKVHEAAALIAGFDPNAVDASCEFFRDTETNLTDSNGIGRVLTVLAALTNAVNAGKLKATIRRNARLQAWDEYPNHGEAVRDLYQPEPVEIRKGFEQAVIYFEAPDWTKTTIDREDLIAWLRSRGHTTGFFFPDAVSDAPDYLNPTHPRYVSKLAAAVRAWQAVTDLGSLHPNQALQKWLRLHASEFDGLTKDDGTLNELSITEVAKVANWKPSGGAPKTPGE